jgi:two-component system, LuxR family, sensor kinase FixL
MIHPPPHVSGDINLKLVNRNIQNRISRSVRYLTTSRYLLRTNAGNPQFLLSACRYINNMKTILIIEDHKEVLENIAEILELARYSTLIAENGKLGVNLAKKNKPDLIICDIMMPELDGYAVLQILSKDLSTSDIPFIFLTAKSEKDDYRRAMQLGADDYLTKPFDDLELLSAIEARLRKNEKMKAGVKDTIEVFNRFILKEKERLEYFINSEMFHTIIENLQDAVIVIDKKGIIIAANTEVLKIYGYEPHELIGMELGILVPERFKETHKIHVKDSFENPVKKRMYGQKKIMALRKDGSEFMADIALSPFKVNDEHYYISSTRDITKQKQDDEALIEQNRDLGKINQELEKYNYTIAHDLKAPFQKISALTDALLEEIKEGKTEDLKNLSDYIHQSISSAEKMITETLDEAKKKKETSENELINIKELLEEINHLIIIPKHFQFKVNCNIPFMPGKKVQLLQVLMNLLTNAIKYNDKPSGEICLTCKDAVENYSLSLTDNGKGIPAEKLPNIFKLFKRNADESVDSHGVGLSTVKAIVESRGGTIIVSSEAGKGTKVKFTWPKISSESSDDV